MWDLPLAVNIDGKEYKIRNNCDYRMVLDVIIALNDTELDEQYRIICALTIFYEDLSDCENLQAAADGMMLIISGGEEEDKNDEYRPQMMDWEHDFGMLAPPISRILTYDIRTPDKYTHWYTFLGGYMEIGECLFATVVSIRKKRMNGKKLEKWEEEFYRENRSRVNLPLRLSEAEARFLDYDF